MNLENPLSKMLLALCLAPLAGSPSLAAPAHERVPAEVQRRLDELSAATPAVEAEVKIWVFFRDKGFGAPSARAAAIAELATSYPERATERRGLRRTAPGLFDARDLPVAEAYAEAVAATGARLVVRSSWLNAVSAEVTADEAAAVAALPMVASIQLVARAVSLAAPMAPAPAPQGTGFYGSAQAQLEQIDLVALHQQGFTGSGVIVGVLDSGFRLDHDAFNQAGHTLQVLAQWDFVNNDGNVGPESGDVAGQSDHGTMVLSTIAAYLPNSLVGGAYDASFVLAKTEDIGSETQVEEDFYVAGLQFIEAQGGDVATSSLGYIDWYSQAQLDGQTAVTTKAVNIATQNGVFCCTAAGNSGNDTDPATSHLIAPADALEVISCGAVDSANVLAGFSSDGATADGRLKPELLALGVSTSAVSPYDTTGYVTVSGTSLSTPLVASAVACLAGAHPTWTVATLRNQLFTTAASIGAPVPDPLFVAGYGLVDALAAHEHLDLGALLPGVSGTTNTLAVSGATPGSPVWLVWGLSPGSMPIPGCAPVKIDIAPIFLYGAAFAGVDGEASFTIPIPAGLAGLGLYLQLGELGSCRASNLRFSVLQ